MLQRPSSVRQRTTILPTPLVADVIFSERVVNQTRVVPAYGTPHPNTARWPNHKFAYARERDEPDSQDTFDYFYVADRANQDQYNFSFTKADIGGTKFDAVARTYVTPRSAFTPNTPAMGATMPNVPSGLFAGTYVLAEKKQTRIGDQELDSLYVAETHVYVKRCNITQLGVDSLNGKTLTSTSTLYYATEAVIQGVTDPQTITVTGTLTPDATDTMNRVEELSGFPQFSTAVNGSTYPATRCYYNGTTWVLSRHTGGSLIPYALWTSSPCTLSACPSPAAAAGWTPTLGVGMATPSGTPIFTDDTDYSPDTTAAQLFADPTNAYWGLQSNGTQLTGRQLSCEWYEITSEVIVSGTFAGGAVTVRTYETTQSYYWPPILSSLEIRLWSRRDGGEQRYVRPIFSKEGYRGECEAEIVDTFHVTAPAITAPSVMLPLPISIQNPFYGVSIGACLFAGATYSFTNGTDDLTYEYTVDNYTFPATSPATWPDFITIINVQPFRGGYMKSTIKIFKPA